jgi:hypothetical protein
MTCRGPDNARALEGEGQEAQKRSRDRTSVRTSLTTLAISIS